LGDTDIICERCHKPANIKAEFGKLCKACWLAVRKEKRGIKQQDSLNKCFSYHSNSKVTKKEAQIINEIFEEMNKNPKHN